MRKRTLSSLNEAQFNKLVNLMKKEKFSDVCVERYLGVPHNALRAQTRDGYGYYSKATKEKVLNLINDVKNMVEEVRNVQRELEFSECENKSGETIPITKELINKVQYLIDHYDGITKIPRKYNVSIATYRSLIQGAFKNTHASIIEKITNAVKETKMSDKPIEKQEPKMEIKETTFEGEIKKLNAEEKVWKEQCGKTVEGSEESRLKKKLNTPPRNNIKKKDLRDLEIGENVADDVRRNVQNEIEKRELLEKGRDELEGMFKEELKPEQVKAQEEAEKARLPKEQKNIWMPKTFREALYVFKNRLDEDDDLDDLLEMIKDMAKTY